MALLKQKKHFNNVDWKSVMKQVEMKDLRKNLMRYQDLHLEKTDIERMGDSHIETLVGINSKLTKKGNLQE